MRRLSFLLVSALMVGLCSGCAVYSTQKFGPQALTGTTLNEVIQRNGAPDIIGGNDELIVLGYTRIEGMEVLGLFGTVKKSTTAVVCDKTGKVISTGTSVPGKAMTIMGAFTSPVGVIEDK